MMVNIAMSGGLPPAHCIANPPKTPTARLVYCRCRCSRPYIHPSKEDDGRSYATCATPLWSTTRFPCDLTPGSRLAVKTFRLHCMVPLAPFVVLVTSLVPQAMHDSSLPSVSAGVLQPSMADAYSWPITVSRSNPLLELELVIRWGRFSLPCLACHNIFRAVCKCRVILSIGFPVRSSHIIRIFSQP